MKDPIILPSGKDLKKPMRHRDPRKGRLLLLALGGIVVLAALVIGVTKLAQAIGEYVELNTDHTVHLTDTTADKVQRIEIQGRTAVTITRRDGVYSVRELSAAVTSQSACEAAFSNAATLLAEGVAAEGVTDFAAYGWTSRSPPSTSPIRTARRFCSRSATRRLPPSTTMCAWTAGTRSTSCAP